MASLVGLLAISLASSAASVPTLKVLFLGDGGHHAPAERMRLMAPPLIARGIYLVYSEDLADLTLENLRRYDGLMVYANIDVLPPAQETALLDYVAQGGGVVAVHSASFSFRNSERYIALIGAQFESHGAETFRTRITAPDHPVMQGFQGFESWDETYVHKKHNQQNRIVLERRGDEPYTWVRSEGQGRVFYTAWGHDERTWTNPGFVDLIERGIRYAAGQQLPQALVDRPKVPGFELIDQAGIPYYQPGQKSPPGQRSAGDGAWPQMPKPLPAEQSMRHLIVPGGFEVQLVASDPQIKKPVVMNWDEQGRLWIAETLDYPNTLLPPGAPGRDRLVVCEDRNNDGRMDKFTVFADGLNIPTGFTFANGGVILHQMPDTLFLKDTNNDGKADIREVLIHGWGREDTHAGPSNLQYGLDNWIWGIVGYSGFDGAVGGQPAKFLRGFYRFQPDGSALEFVRQLSNNAWGLGFSEEGLVFGSTANGNPSDYMPFANRYYSRIGKTPATLTGIAETARALPVTSRVRQVDVHWGYTAAAGHALYTARSYPKSYWNRAAFVAEPTAHLVGQFNLERDGAGLKSKNPINLIASDDEWFSPIMAEVGPDGAVWVVDWYNYIVQHNPTPKGRTRGAGNAYESELRDKRFGRIYRIVWKDAKPAPKLSLAGATPAKLVQTLTNDNMFWRRHAQRLLVERGRKDVVPALIDLLRDRGVDEINLNVGAIHALWTLHGLQAIDAYPDVQAAVVDALRHPSAGVRRAAVGVLPRTLSNGAEILKIGLLADPDAQVRLAALLAMTETPKLADADVTTLAAALKRPEIANDRWCAEAAQIVSILFGFAPAAGAAGAPESKPGAKELDPNTVTLQLGVVPDVMKYDRAELSVPAGRPVRLMFNNSDQMQHNVVILQPGSAEEVGGLADKMLTDPQAVAKAYVPNSPKILAHTMLVDPGKSTELKFNAPTKPGRYPILCTFPGHWRIMQATLIVTAAQ